jgi:hypothetical protein
VTPRGSKAPPFHCPLVFTRSAAATSSLDNLFLIKANKIISSLPNCSKLPVQRDCFYGAQVISTDIMDEPTIIKGIDNRFPPLCADCTGALKHSHVCLVKGSQSLDICTHKSLSPPLAFDQPWIPISYVPGTRLGTFTLVMVS